MSKDEVKVEPLIQFQSVQGYELIEKRNEHEELEIEIYKGSGSKRKLWAVFYGDRANAAMSMYNAYIATLTRVAAEAKARVEDPDRTQATKEKSKEVISGADAIPLFANAKKIQH